MRNLSNAELAKILDKDIFHLISQAADSLGLECYVVGGYVRDLFLERPSNDIDVVVVGSGIQVASALKQKLGRKAHLSVFRNFGTAQVKYRDIEVEFVGARKESYNHDSRKPIVEDGTLEDDQNRRDFTINALAVCLNSKRFGELVDPFDGVYDLEDGIVATPLDPDITFSDDPLRMMRKPNLFFFQAFRLLIRGVSTLKEAENIGQHNAIVMVQRINSARVFRQPDHRIQRSIHPVPVSKVRFVSLIESIGQHIVFMIPGYGSYTASLYIVIQFQAPIEAAIAADKHINLEHGQRLDNLPVVPCHRDLSDAGIQHIARSIVFHRIHKPYVKIPGQLCSRLEHNAVQATHFVDIAKKERDADFVFFRFNGFY